MRDAPNSNLPPRHLLEALCLPRAVHRLQLARQSATTLREAMDLLATEAEARRVATLAVDPFRHGPAPAREQPSAPNKNRRHVNGETPRTVPMWWTPLGL
jgi:hypothetical protein